MKSLKKLLFIIICFAAIINSLQAQELTPEANKALINILLVDGNKQPVEHEIIFKSEKDGTKYTAKTNKRGLAKILLPVNENYIIDIGSKIGYDIIKIPDEEYFNITIKYIMSQNKNRNKL